MRLIYNNSRDFAVLFKYGFNLHGTVLFRIIIFNLKISNENLTLLKYKVLINHGSDVWEEGGKHVPRQQPSTDAVLRKAGSVG